MTAEDIEEYKLEIGKENEYGIEEGIQLFGYTSTSLEKDTAMKFAWENSTTGHQKVIFKIKWQSDSGNYFLNAGAFDQEREVLLMDGTRLFVEEIEEIKNENGQKLYFQITLTSFGYEE